MLTGIVNGAFEATLRLVLKDVNGLNQQMEAIIDTGFSGYLTMPSALITSLGLPWRCRQQGLLADGSIINFDVYAAIVIWDGRLRNVEVEAAETLPLLGMSLLRRHHLEMDVIAGGRLNISALP